MASKQAEVWAAIFGRDAAPDTCPWRAYQDPVVSEVVAVFGDIGGFTERGPDLATFMLTDPPHVLLDGLRSMRRAMSAMIRHEEWKQAQEMERLRKQGGRRGR